MPAAHVELSCQARAVADHRQVSRQYKHRRGHAVTHLGRRRHGADDISEGHRVNLIMWNYNSAYRASKSYAAQWYEVEARTPDPRCVSYTHDRDWEAVTGEPRPEAKFERTAWCPPPRAEYAGFEGVDGKYATIDPGRAATVPPRQRQGERPLN